MLVQLAEEARREYAPKRLELKVLSLAWSLIEDPVSIVSCGVSSAGLDDLKSFVYFWWITEFPDLET
ncbi:MAG: hypothetical protein BYD32DRAFT_424256 [Podila humilis]|nr:MAG: hypothetical protein BYD32DRAFT_424256 [Podila humilis]